MGFRFRRSVRVAPGLRINLGKKKASLSIGSRGATINVSDRGVKTTVGVPGTGMSYVDEPSSRLAIFTQNDSNKMSKGLKIFIVIWVMWVVWYLS